LRRTLSLPQVDGSLGTWTYVLIDLHHQRDPPALTLASVLILLPVVHKYNFTKLLARLVAFVREKSGQLDHDYGDPFTFVITWLALSERLQVDELREVCLGVLRGMSREQLQTATTVEVEVGTGADKQTRRSVREEVKVLGQALCFEVFAIAMTDQAAPSSDDDDDDDDDE
jgi:hypothetical protein